MSIGPRIELGATAKGWSLTQLAKAARLPSRTYLYRMKTGDRAGRKHLGAIAKALGCSVEWLATGGGVAPSWARQPTTITRKEPFAEALTLLGATMKSVAEEGRRRGAKVDEALQSLEAARISIERL